MNIIPPSLIKGIAKSLASTPYKQLTRKEKLLRELAKITEQEEKVAQEQLRIQAGETAMSWVDGNKRLFEYHTPFPTSTVSSTTVYYATVTLNNNKFVLNGIGISLEFNGKVRTIFDVTNNGAFDVLYLKEVTIGTATIDSIAELTSMLSELAML